jgi:branched-chain amino acid transport system permease protein
MNYILHIFVVTCIYIILAISLDLIAGHLGLLSIAHAAFYGIGAYTSALLTTNLGVSFLGGVVSGILISAIISLAISIPSIRLHDDYFVLATFGFQVVLFSVLNNWVNLTNGPLGITGIPEAGLFGYTINSTQEYIAAVGGLAVLSYLLVWSLTSSPYGRVLHAIREDEVFTQSLGKNVLKSKVVTIAIGAALAALAGSLYAHYVSYISPTNFDIMESILVLSMVIIGGAGSLWGPIVGAVILVALPESLRFLGLPSAVAANIRQIVYGLLLVLMMIIRPSGLMGHYDFRQ